VAQASVVPVDPNGLLAREWRAFERRMLDHARVPRTQRQILRRAWFAGAASMLEAVSIMGDPGADCVRALAEELSLEAGLGLAVA
jgi:hypothetical protein